MSLATVASRALAGIDAPEVAVEVHLGPGLPSFTIVGLPDAEVREAKDRVRAALVQSIRLAAAPAHRSSRTQTSSPRRDESCLTPSFTLNT